MPVALAHETLGSGEPLLILHGLFGSKRNWMSIAKPLSRFARVIAVDLRNHGDSGRAPTMSYREMAADIAALADELRLEQVNIAGHSMGGKVAMMFALDHPARTRRLIVLDAAPVRYGTGFNRFVEAMRALPVSELNSREQADAGLSGAVPDPTTRQFLLHNLVREGSGFRWRLNLDGIADSLEELMDFPPLGANHPGPALFLAAGRADYLLPAHHPTVRRLFPAAEFHTLADAGHWLHADRPEAVVGHLHEFLSAGHGGHPS
jgi:pimeloyl-ACP methyl ester carboxylesterase